MKAFIIFAITVTLSVLAAADKKEMGEEMKKYFIECFKETNLPLDHIKKLSHAGDVKPEDISDDMKCAVHCAMQKMGTMDENGKIKPDEVKAMLDEDEKQEFEKYFKECDAITAANPCEVAFLTFGCLAAAMKK